MTKCTRPRPEKPREDFPLWPHKTGSWTCRIRLDDGTKKQFYFGKWEDPQGAEALYRHELPYLKQGRTPPPFGQDVKGHQWCTMKRLCNAFIHAKSEAVTGGDLAVATLQDYYGSCKAMCEFFGRDRRVDDLDFTDFAEYRKELSRTLSAVSLANEINRCRVVFRWGYRNGLLREEVRTGDAFKRPPAKRIRMESRQAGQKLFTRDEIHRILAECNPPMKAMVLLGLNCGYGNTDVAYLRRSMIDWKNKTITYPRPKTQEERSAILWPETVEALREAIRCRPRPLHNNLYGDHVFITRQGNPYVRMTVKPEQGWETATRNDAVTGEFRKLLRALKINGRKRLGFYSLRHTCETIGQRANQQAALNHLMGHVDNSMAANYRQEIYRPHLQAVVDVIRDWLFGEGGEA